jgi:hypothetical protein
LFTWHWLRADDGSAYYNDSYNVLLGGGGWTKHSGPFQMAMGNIWISAASDHGKNCASGISADIQPFKNNTCIGQWSNIEEDANKTAGWTANNQFYTMPLHSNVTINDEPLAAAQAAGLERGSSEHTLSSIGAEGVLQMVRQLLTMEEEEEEEA